MRPFEAVGAMLFLDGSRNVAERKERLRRTDRAAAEVKDTDQEEDRDDEEEVEMWRNRCPR